MEHHFNLSENLVDNLHLYSSNAQLKMHAELAELQSKSASQNQYKFALFQAHVYIFAIGVFPTGKIVILKTHPVSLDLYGNINGIIATKNMAVDNEETASQWRRRYLHSVTC